MKFVFAKQLTLLCDAPRCRLTVIGDGFTSGTDCKQFERKDPRSDRHRSTSPRNPGPPFRAATGRRGSTLARGRGESSCRPGGRRSKQPSSHRLLRQEDSAMARQRMLRPATALWVCLLISVALMKRGQVTGRWIFIFKRPGPVIYCQCIIKEIQRTWGHRARASPRSIT